jgi:predicted MPP superfamily phosphohydrolase
MHAIVMVLTGIAVGSAALDIVVFLLLARRLSALGVQPPESARLRATGVLGAFVATAVFAAFRAIALAVVGISIFGIMRVLFVELALGVPLAGTFVLLAGRVPAPLSGKLKPTAAARVCAVLMLAPAPLAFVAVFVEPQRLVVERVDVPVAGMQQNAPPFRIAVLADLQFRYITEHEREAVRLALADHPDIIVVPGDIFEGSHAEYLEERTALRELLSPLSAPGGVFLIEGDHDEARELADLVAGTQIRFLQDEVATTSVRGTKIAIAGLGISYGSASSRSALHALTASEADIRLVLVHRPDAVFVLPEPSNVDLTIAGHTHGGQVQIPFFGPLITLSHVPRKSAGGGLTEVQGHRLYVSRGVGMERNLAPPIRFQCPPEVTQLQFTPR